MAKAILGYVGGDPHVHRDNVTLRRRVADLEAVIMRLQAENDALHAQLMHDELLLVPTPEPVAAT